MPATGTTLILTMPPMVSFFGRPLGLFASGAVAAAAVAAAGTFLGAGAGVFFVSRLR